MFIRPVQRIVNIMRWADNMNDQHKVNPLRVYMVILDTQLKLGYTGHTCTCVHGDPGHPVETWLYRCHHTCTCSCKLGLKMPAQQFGEKSFYWVKIWDLSQCYSYLSCSLRNYRAPHLLYQLPKLGRLFGLRKKISHFGHCPQNDLKSHSSFQPCVN
jgi:hypothetical protein